MKIDKTIIQPIVLLVYGCVTWSLSLREECRLSVFENGYLGEYLGPKGMRMVNAEALWTVRNFIVGIFPLSYSGWLNIEE